jgi:hypothetical protein
MKRILLACFLLTATMSVTSVPHASAYAPSAPVTSSAFTAKVNLMDSQIGGGDMTSAHATWNEIHDMMLSVLGVTKNSIRTAATPTDEATYRAILTNQTSVYQTIWGLKPDLATNRVAIHTKLLEFSSTIY